MNKNDRIKELELRIAVLESQKNRVRRRLKLEEQAVRIVIHHISPFTGMGFSMRRFLRTIANNLVSIDHEYDRYHV